MYRPQFLMLLGETYLRLNKSAHYFCVDLNNSCIETENLTVSKNERTVPYIIILFVFEKLFFRGCRYIYKDRRNQIGETR